jgi:hypothetical protein
MGSRSKIDTGKKFHFIGIAIVIGIVSKWFHIIKSNIGNGLFSRIGIGIADYCGVIDPQPWR